MRKNSVKSIVLSSLVVLAIAVLLILEIFRGHIFGVGEYSNDLYVISTKLLGGLLCTCFVCHFLGRGVLKFSVGKRILTVFLPCMIVAVNNFPFVSLFIDRAHVNPEPVSIAVFALSCICTGFFEEIAFRGCIFTCVLREGKRTRKNVFFAIVISSAVFAAVHILNLFAGAGLGDVILQIGYSFLIGALCAIVYIRCGNIWFAVILHSVYNFAGNVVTECGTGDIWTLPQIIFTFVVSVCIAAYVVYQFFKIDNVDIDKLLNDAEKTEK